MASSQSSETCAEHKISVADDSQKVKRLQRAQWLRAAILGANDGLLSTTSIMLGVGAASKDKRSMVLSGLAGALAGACSMAVGEFVSVATQRDIEKATATSQSSKNDREHAPIIKLCITADPASSKDGAKRLTDAVTPSENVHSTKLISDQLSPNMILEPRLPPGMSPGRSPIMKVIQEDATIRARILQEDDKRDVLGNPYKAAVASGLSFLIGAFVPLASAIFVSQNVARIVAVAVVTSIALAFFGGFGAYLGGSHIRISAARVLFGGWIAMGFTYGLLTPFDSDNKGSKDTD